MSMPLAIGIKRPRDLKKEKRKKQRTEDSPDSSLEANDTFPIEDEHLEIVSSSELAKPITLDSEQIFNWDKKDLDLLIANVSEHLPKNDNFKYSSTLEKINWEKVKFKEYTAEECKEHFDLILSRLRKFRTLTELLNDAKNWLKQPYANNVYKRFKHPDAPKKPLTPFFRFFMDKRAKYTERNPGISVTELSKLISGIYANLSEKKKAKYKALYDAEMIQYREEVEKFRAEHPDIGIMSSSSRDANRQKGPVKPKTPAQLFIQAKALDTNDPIMKKENLEALRKKWIELPDNKRMKWIKRAVADEKRFLEEVVEYKKIHPDYEVPNVKVLNKAEKELKDRCEGKPDKPPNSGYSLYSKLMLKEIQGCESKEKMSIIAKRWKELTPEEKECYNSEVKKEMKKYVEQLLVYLNSLSEEERAKALSERNIQLPSSKKFREMLHS